MLFKISICGSTNVIMHSRPQCRPAGGWLRGTGNSGDEKTTVRSTAGTSPAGRFWVTTGVTCDQAFFSCFPVSAKVARAATLSRLPENKNASSQFTTGVLRYFCFSAEVTEIKNTSIMAKARIFWHDSSPKSRLTHTSNFCTYVCREENSPAPVPIVVLYDQVTAKRQP